MIQKISDNSHVYRIGITSKPIYPVVVSVAYTFSDVEAEHLQQAALRFFWGILHRKSDTKPVRFLSGKS